VWENGKRGVKALKKVYILNILMYLVEKKKYFLQQLRKKRSVFQFRTKKHVFKQRKKAIGFGTKLFFEVNALVLPLVERVLKQIPKKFMDLNRKTRVYKYLRRNNKKLFQSRDRLVSELVLILERKRRKPFWRRTRYEHFLRKYQLLRSYYGNMNFHWFRSLCRKKKFYISGGDNQTQSKYQAIDFYKLLESRLDIVIFRAGLVHSVFQARQFINHGKIYVNSKRVKQPAYLLQEGDVVSWDVSFFEEQSRARRLRLGFYLYDMLSVLGKANTTHLFSKNAPLKKAIRLFRDSSKDKVSDMLSDSFLGTLNKWIPYTSNAWDGIEKATRFSRFRFLAREIPEHLLVSEKAAILIFLKQPECFLYPFSMTIRDFKKIVNYLHI
jgi:ribosomal protein S4